MRKIFLICCFMLVAGCTSAPQYQSPAPLITKENSESYKLFKHDGVNTASHVQVHLDEAKDIAYVQSFGGGGVALGVAFGPLGVLANISMIQAETNSDLTQLYNKIPIPVSAMFTEAASAKSIHYDDNAEGRFHPFMMVVRDENETLRMGTALIVELPQADGKVWSGRYTHQTAVHVPLKNVADGLDESEYKTIYDAIQQSFNELTDIYQQDRLGQLTDHEQILVNSTFLTPRITIELNGVLLKQDENRVLVRSGLGIISLPQDDSLELEKVRVKASKKRAKS